jgi:hypothetical protein
LFTNQLKYLLDKFHFILVVTARCFKILFRRNKDIKKLFLNYETEHLFDTSYIVINYRFTNALYYQFGTTKTLEKHIKIFDLNNCDKEMDFVVYGLFDKKAYKLKFEPQLTLEKTSFKTQLFNLNLKLFPVNPRIIKQDIHLKTKNVSLVNQTIQVSQNKLYIKTNSFTQNDFL